MSSQFLDTGSILQPEAIVYRFSDDSLKILFNIPEKNLLFISADDHFICRLSVQYSLYTSYTSSQPVDSGSVHFELKSLSETAALTDQFSLKYNDNRPLVLRLLFRDLNRNTESARYIRLLEGPGLSNQRVLLCNTTGYPLYHSFVSGPGVYKVLTGNLSSASLHVRCFFKDYPLAVLPFRVIDDPVFDLKPDSVFKVSVSDLENFDFSGKGIWYFQTDTSSSQGFAFTVFDPDFPKVTRAEQLVESTRYITTRREYLQLMSSTDKKAALDKFWLEIGGNPDRARLLIRVYYNRVQEANRLFSSYLEGWKTDRGMIHMIYGKPQSVYRDGETEQWTYSNLPGFPDMLFLFRKMNNPFTDNDYALIRQPVYENLWYIAVDQWRQGRIVNDY